eukprot:CAMPEP_0183304390 /NCGR_PEP_ID=MMETSP0160_2-20130417/9489_1 /TAXON_ID=2839 ORGANISM="Odontella Sinensis, Strain Grunow 1884" /NCGR_SAMPLE_ID=MMETSP0160_2 /ASSEMBLY_ACC=CAM_ASM_000250 /LENGTH=737 /DNA_ID=CAMNT_0025467431 /DNA_START=67 /DNA_END=2280 /DNA_ORIENTATION=-
MTTDVQQQHQQPPVNEHNIRMDMMKRSVKVIDAEVESGNTEYKRQLSKPTASRLRSLATQMSYRLDEGHGRCTYHVGVEDDGCHSLLGYRSVSESARLVECIARSLNAVVLERLMIQREVKIGKDGKAKLCPDRKAILVASEPPVLGAKGGRTTVVELDEGEDGEDCKEEKMSEDTASRPKKDRSLDTTDMALTRCELTIQRVETHLIDASPLSLMQLVAGVMPGTTTDRKNAFGRTRAESSLSDGVADSAEATTIDQQVPADKPVIPGKENASSPDSYSVSETLSKNNIRIAVVGNVDAGKSTLIGSLTTSTLDDGRGRCRTSIMKHRHEIESGRTSTATTHLLGFRHTGETISGKDKLRNPGRRRSEDEIARESYRVATLIDLAGHEKYLKTTIHGVSSGMADYGLILVNSRHPPTHMTQHHLNLCCSFGIPVIVVFTKVDGCPEHAIKNSKQEVFKMLRAPDIGKRPFAVRNEADVTTCMGKLHSLAPVLETSCVSGQGMDLLRKMLFSLPKRRRHENKVNRNFEFLVEDIFNVPGVGAVVSGFVNAGELEVGSGCHVYVGPTDDGTFLKTVAKSAHIARINTSHVTSGQSACLALSLGKDLRKKLRRGMVVLQKDPACTREFDAEICVLKGEGTTIRKSYQAYVHILNVRQSAYARHIELVDGIEGSRIPLGHGRHSCDEEGLVLRPGSRAKVRFEFAKRPEYIRPGMRMLFRDGRVRGVGIITNTLEVQPVA